MTSFSIQNFGCRVNQAEAFGWAEEMESRGWRFDEDSTRADLVVINTCTLTGKADRDVRKFIRKITRLNPAARLVVTGCMVNAGRIQTEGMPSHWVVIPNEGKVGLVDRVVPPAEGRRTTPEKHLRSRAPLKIQDGCDERCTFCVIPRVRGRSRSLVGDNILARARGLAGQGFREIILCGIHLSSYGLDLRPKSSLLDIVRELTDIEEIKRIRLSSLDPRFMDERLTAFLVGNPKICPHFHLSLQHGSEGILKRMGRTSKISEYLRILTELRRDSPTAALGADIMVGFPGESDDDIDAMIEFLKQSPITYIHVFAYSPRPGTTAAGWPQVDERLKRERSARLRKLSAEKRRAFHLTFLTKELDGIIIRRRDGGGEVLTENYISIQVPVCSDSPGEEIKVRLTDVGPMKCRGEIISR
jgi:threonylcarbamoyladenosine tRNA methylthiotransferase MtaB